MNIIQNWRLNADESGISGHGKLKNLLKLTNNYMSFTIKVEINEEMIQNIINLKDWSWDTIEQKIATKALDSAVHQAKLEIMKDYVKFDYSKFSLTELVKNAINKELWEYIEKYIHIYLEKNWSDTKLQLKVETMLRNTMENKLTEYTQNILSNLMVVNTSQENN